MSTIVGILMWMIILMVISKKFRSMILKFVGHLLLMIVAIIATPLIIRQQAKAMKQQDHDQHY